MSDEKAATPEKSPKPIRASVPRTRRVATPRAKKAAKVAAPDELVAAEVVEAPAPEPAAVEREDAWDAPSAVGAEWPEPEAESAGGSQPPSEAAKRKRRRRKGKGQGQAGAPQNGGALPVDEVHSPVTSEPKAPEAIQELRPRPQQNTQVQQQQQPQRAKIDPEFLTKMAWKIYLAEVSEEGVALIGDSDAKDLSRRCFRLAEIFIEEQNRRR